MDSGTRDRCTRSAPCLICGTIDWDMRMHYILENGKTDTVHWCHKTRGAKGDIISVGGTQYICISAGRQIDTGEFYLWKEYLSKEEWKKKYEGISTYNYSSKPSYNISNEPITGTLGKDPVPGEEKVLPVKQLHEIYSYMLSLLVLEPKHYRLLAEEWNNPIYPNLCNTLCSGLTSLPPIDKARYANKETFKNITRKELVKRLLEKFGDLRGVPGFYLRSGSYYKDKPESERWTVSGGEGILFPCYNKDGLIWRPRYREDYPSIEIKEGIHPSFNGKWGTFHHYYNKEGYHCYSFQPKGEGSSEVVVDPTLKIHKIMPGDIKGKASGKYKTLSSLKLKTDGASSINIMEGGCGSGSPYSFYARKDQNYTIVLGTEGEKKAMICSLLKNFPSVSLPGVWCFASLFYTDEDGESFIDKMKKKGMKYFLLCYDADKTENETVMNAEKAFIEALKKAGVTPLIGEWKGKYNKGIDDILLMGLDITIRPA